MSQYMLLIRGGYEEWNTLTPEQMQQSIEQYRAWAGRLSESGKLVGAEKLSDGDGRLVRMHNGQVVVDGPFTETKESVGGYFLIEAASFAEAIEIAKECPGLTRGVAVEVRQIEKT
jgi:hypothetical protein